MVPPLPPRTCAPIRRACPWWLRPATASMGPSGGPPACWTVLLPQRSRSGMSVSRAGLGLGVRGPGRSRACWAVPGWHCPGPPGLEHTPSLGALLRVAMSAGGGGTAPLAPDRNFWKGLVSGDIASRRGLLQSLALPTCLQHHERPQPPLHPEDTGVCGHPGAGAGGGGAGTACRWAASPWRPPPSCPSCSPVRQGLGGLPPALGAQTPRECGKQEHFGFICGSRAW